MSKQNLYTIYDLEAQTTLGPVIPHARHAAATRMFSEVLADKNTTPGKYPEQFHLIWIGEQDTETAEITPREPTPVLTGADWLKQQRQTERHMQLERLKEPVREDARS